MDPILLEFPDTFETDRLTIRSPRAGDGLEVFEAIQESIAELRAWMPWAQDEPTVDASEAYVRHASAHWAARTDLPLLLFNKGTNLFLGGSGLHRFDWSLRSFEIGYWIRSSMSGQGYITEAVNGITEYAFNFLKATRVQIRMDSRNSRSIAVARRCGFMLEGTLRHEALDVKGMPRDTVVFSKIAAEEFHK